MGAVQGNGKWFDYEMIGDSYEKMLQARQCFPVHSYTWTIRVCSSTDMAIHTVVLMGV